MDSSDDNALYYGTLVLFYLVIFLLGFITNGIVLVFVMCLKNNQTTTNKYIANLAFSDLLVVLLCIPFTASRVNFKLSWPFGDELCYIAHYVENVGASVSILSLVALSFERYFIIKYSSNQNNTWLYKKRFMVTILCIWTISLISMSPLLFTHRLVNLKFNNTFIHKVCVNDQWPSFEAKLAFELFTFLIFYLIPLIIITYSYFFIGKSLLKVKRHFRITYQNRNNEGLSSNLDQLNVENLIEEEDNQRQIINNKNIEKSIKVIIKIVFLFAFTWLPYHIVNLSREVLGYVHLMENQGNLNYTIQSPLIDVANYLSIAHPIVTCIALSNCATNSLLYIILCIDIRNDFSSENFSSFRKIT